MREFETTLGGRSVVLVASFKASQEIAKKLADPLVIAREAGVEAMAIKLGVFSHQPKFKWTVENVPLLLHIGIKSAGGTATLEEVQELVFSEGFATARGKAEDYLALIVGPRSEEIAEREAIDAPGE